MMIMPVENEREDLVPQPKPNEVIVQRFDISKFDLDECVSRHEYLQQQFPNNQIISLPTDFSLEYFSKEELLQMMEKLIQDIKAIRCVSCHELKYEENFYRSKNLTKYPNGRLDICKDCLKERFDRGIMKNDNPRTFSWLLRAIDIPFIQQEWESLVKRYGDRYILGRYVSKMFLRGYRGYTYEDSEELNNFIKNN